MQRFRAYFHLLKPGITISNTISAMAGFMLGVSTIHTFTFPRFVALTLGIAAIIGSACVINNVIDEKIDAKMKRTKRREIVTGVIAKPVAVSYGVTLGILGFGLIFSFTNLLTGILGLIAYLSYVVIYGAAKRTTIWSTVIGTLPGALPLVAGYTTVTGRLDGATLVLFVMMLLWQLGHFYAIAMFRRDDYAAAGVPVWSVAKGMASTKHQLFVGVWLFVCMGPLLTLMGYTHFIFAVLMTGTALVWGLVGWKRYAQNDVAWARSMFGVSLIVLLVMCGLIAIGGFVV
jgi:protoheme IX farnesyltransferase